jgi:hypothetical protein
LFIVKPEVFISLGEGKHIDFGTSTKGLEKARRGTRKGNRKSNNKSSLLISSIKYLEIFSSLLCNS